MQHPFLNDNVQLSFLLFNNIKNAYFIFKKK